MKIDITFSDGSTAIVKNEFHGRVEMVSGEKDIIIGAIREGLSATEELKRFGNIISQEAEFIYQRAEVPVQ